MLRATYIQIATFGPSRYTWEDNSSNSSELTLEEDLIKELGTIGGILLSENRKI